MKKKTQYRCNECGYMSLKWYGRCPNCNMWDSMVLIDSTVRKENKKITIVQLDDVHEDNYQNIKLKDIQLNRLFGDGFVKGEIILIAGAPGSGKSTFTINIMNNLNNEKILYISGEESALQIKKRFERLSYRENNTDLMISPDSEDIIAIAEKEDYTVLIIDSIQTINSSENRGVAGSPTMVKFILGEISKICKQRNITVIIIGHITKDGNIAGPKTLEHMVDSVFILDVLDNNMRIIKSVKNRFGSTDEMLLMNMKSDGLDIVDNIDAVTLTGTGGTGKAITCTMKGSIPVAVEVQGLVTYSKYGIPQRIASGIQYKRLQMLLGIMDKYMSVNLGDRDVFVNVSGGLGLDDSLCDLAFINAVYSSFSNNLIANDTAFIGEINLSGEIVWKNDAIIRIKHLKHLNIKKIIVPHSADIDISDLEIIRIKKISELENI